MNIKPTCDNSAFENDVLSFSLSKRVIFFKKNEILIPLTVLQSRLIFSLLSGTTDKNSLIKDIWQERHVAITDNNYHQLIHQCRSAFRKHGIPPEVIKTLHCHGVMFDILVIPSPFIKKTDSSVIETPKNVNKWQLFIWSMLALSSILTLFIVAGH